MVRTKFKTDKLVRTRFKAPRTKPGPKREFSEEMLAEVEDLVGKLGARNTDLAVYYNVDASSINGWIQARPEFAKAVKRGRITKALRVSRALYSRAIGYSHPDTHILPNRVKIYDTEGNLIEERTEALIIPITKHYPPETFAAHKYLSIIFRDVWADITKVNVNHRHSGDINIHKIEELSMDDLSKEMKDLLFDLNMKQLSDVQPN